MSGPEIRACQQEAKCIEVVSETDCAHFQLNNEFNRNYLLRLITASRSGSPEGWPEGADVMSGFDLACYMGEAPDAKWEVLKFVGPDRDWVEVTRSEVKEWPDDLCFAARRKPKPVTRDVLAWDLEPGMRLAPIAAGLVSGTVATVVRRLGAAGQRLVDARTSEDFDLVRVVSADQPIPVLVEEPNG